MRKNPAKIDNDGDLMVWILNVLLTRSENFLNIKKNELARILQIVREDKSETKDVLLMESTRSDELLWFISEIKEKLSKLTYDDILDDIKKSDFCTTFIERWFKETSNSWDLYKQIIKIFIWWLYNTKIFTSWEKAVLLHELKLAREIIKTKKDPTFIAFVDKILNILNFLGLSIFGREILTTRSFRQYISCKIDRENWDYYLGMMDIDNFKSINDIFWHQVWDLVLKSIFIRLNERVWSWFWFRYWWEEIWLIVNQEFLKKDRITEFDIPIDDIGNWQIKLIRDIQKLFLEKTKDGEKIFFTNLVKLHEQLGNNTMTKIEKDEVGEYCESKTNKKNLTWYYLEKKWDTIHCTYISGKREMTYHRRIHWDILTTTVSIWLSKLDENDFETQKSINKNISEADSLLYKAKDGWRNKIEVSE